MTNVVYVTEDNYFKRTSELKGQLIESIGDYVANRPYLKFDYLTTMLFKMGYSASVAKDLVLFVQQCAQSAFERGVFSVSSVVCRSEGFDAKTPKQLVQELIDEHPGFFEPKKWYQLREFENELFSDRYCTDIIREIAALALRHARAGFAKGINASAELLVTKDMLSSYLRSNAHEC